MVRRSGSIDSAIWNNHSLKVPVNPDNNHSPLLSKAMHVGYINKVTCRLLLLTRHCLWNSAFFLVLQTLHSFVGTFYLVFLLLVINSTMGEFCCLKFFFFFFFLLVKSPVKPKQMWCSAKLWWWTFVRLGGRRFHSYEIPFMLIAFRYWNNNSRIIKSWKRRDRCSNLMSFTFR